MEKLQVVYRKVNDLIPYARNARTHSEEQVTRLASSIKEFGFTNPILLDGENGVIAGHGRLLASKKLGLKEVPCIELAGLTKTQKQAYILADNKLALDAGLDDELVKIELDDLKEKNFDIGSLGLDSIVSEISDSLDVPDSVDYESKCSILIECDSEEQQAKLFEEFKRRGLQCRLHDL